MEGALPEGLRGRLLALALTVTILAVLWAGCVQPLIDWHAARSDTLEQRRALLQRMSTLATTLPELQRQASGEHAPAAALLEGASDAIAGAALQSLVQHMTSMAGAELNSMEILPAATRHLSPHRAACGDRGTMAGARRIVESGRARFAAHAGR
jgi:type II secretory pathway component PulM